MHHGACCFKHSPDFTDCADYMPGDAKLFCVWAIACLCTVHFQIAHWGIAQLTLCYKTLASLVSSAILTTHTKNFTHPNDTGLLPEDPDKGPLWEVSTHPQLGSVCPDQRDDKPIIKVQCQ